MRLDHRQKTKQIDTNWSLKETTTTNTNQLNANRSEFSSCNLSALISFLPTHKRSASVTYTNKFLTHWIWFRQNWCKTFVASGSLIPFQAIDCYDFENKIYALLIIDVQNVFEITEGKTETIKSYNQWMTNCFERYLWIKNRGFNMIACWNCMITVQIYTQTIW